MPDQYSTGPDMPIMALESGMMLTGYRLMRQIGRGGMGVIFLATDVQLRRHVALKVISPECAGDEKYRKLFIREALAAAAVDEPHIIPIYEASEAQGILFIAMRFISSGDVSALLRQGPLSSRRAAAIVSQAAWALDAAHRAGLIHRDVKPANMLVDTHPNRPDHVYLSDFGLSRWMSSSSNMSSAIAGTWAYIAPERLRQENVTGYADQYSLACVAFELLCGRPPYPHADSAAVLSAHLHEAPPILSGQNSSFPQEVDRVFSQALAKKPGDRYQNCDEFANALQNALRLERYHLNSAADFSAGERFQTRHVSSRPTPRAPYKPTVEGFQVFVQSDPYSRQPYRKNEDSVHSISESVKTVQMGSIPASHVTADRPQQRDGKSRSFVKAGALGIPPIIIMLWIAFGPYSHKSVPETFFLIPPICLGCFGAGLGILIRTIRER